MSSFDKYSNYTENTGFSSIIFGSEKPVLEVELNELQQIIDTKISRLFRLFGTCVVPLSDNSVTFDSGTLTLSDCIVVCDRGFSFYVKSITLVLNSENPYAYFKVKEVTVDYNSTINEYGYESGAVIPNLIKDSRSPSETSKRKAVVYSISRGSSIPENTDTIMYVPIGVLNSNKFTLLSKGKFDEFEEEINSISQYIQNIGTSFSYLGQGFGVCDTEEVTKAKVVYLPNYNLNIGGLVAVKFTNGVPENSTMNINSRGAMEIYYKGVPITSNIIKEGDIALFIFDGAFYHLLSVDRNAEGSDLGVLGENKTTTFNNDGSISESYSNGNKKVTVFNEDGSITETLYDSEDTVLGSKKTTFNEDGSISEVVKDGE